MTSADYHQVTLEALTITGGKTIGDGQRGGGIEATGFAELTLNGTTVSGNSTAGIIYRRRGHLTGSLVGSHCRRAPSAPIAPVALAPTAAGSSPSA